MTAPNLELQTIPDSYSPDWIDKLDMRTRIGQAVHARLYSLETDAGGHEDLSYQIRSLCRRAVWMEVVIEREELKLARGEDIDQGKMTQAVNSLVGLLRTIGLQRVARQVDPQSYIAQYQKKNQEAPAVGD